MSSRAPRQVRAASARVRRTLRGAGEARVVPPAGRGRGNGCEGADAAAQGEHRPQGSAPVAEAATRAPPARALSPRRARHIRRPRSRAARARRSHGRRVRSSGIAELGGSDRVHERRRRPAAPRPGARRSCRRRRRVPHATHRRCRRRTATNPITASAEPVRARSAERAERRRHARLQQPGETAAAASTATAATRADRQPRASEVMRRRSRRVQKAWRRTGSKSVKMSVSDAHS